MKWRWSGRAGPVYWVSGIFFTADTLPDSVRTYFLWNPALHCSEMVRDGWFQSFESEYARPGFVLSCILLLGAAGLFLERAVRRRIELT